MDNVFQKGIPLTIAWNLTKPDGTAFDLNGYAHRMFYTVGNRHKEVSGTSVSGNVISWVFPANEQTAAGDYTMTLMIYQNGSLFCKLTYANAFSLFHGSAAGGNSSQQQQTSNVVNLYSAAEYYLFQPVVPVVGDDGFWYVNGVRISDGSGNYIPSYYGVKYDPTTKWLYIYKGDPDVAGNPVVEIIKDIAVAFAAWQAEETARMKAEGQLGSGDPDYQSSRIRQEEIRQANEAVRQRNEGTKNGSAPGDGSRWGDFKQAQVDRAAAYAEEEGTQAGSSAGDGSRWGDYKTAEAARDTARETVEGTASSVAGDGTRWGAMKAVEGTASSEAGDGSRWGAYKTAEDNRDTARANAEGTASSTAGDGTRWGAYKSAEAARDAARLAAEGTASSEAGDGTRWGAFKTNESARNDAMAPLVGSYVCETAAATAAKTVAATGYVLGGGGAFKVKFTYANTVASPTLNVNSTGAKAIVFNGAVASASNSWGAGEVVEFYYDPTYDSNAGAFIGRSTVISVSQNTETGHAEINIGGVANPVASVEDVSQLGQEVFGSNVADIDSYGEIRYCNLVSSSNNEVVITYTANGNYSVVFFPIENNKIYKLHVPNARDGKVFGFCNEKITSAPQSGTSTNLGGKMYDATAISGNTFDIKIQNMDNYQYLVVLFTHGTGNLPTLKEYDESSVVLYSQQLKSSEEKRIARQNIGAASQEDISLLQLEQDAQEKDIEKVSNKLDYNLVAGNIVPELAGSEVGIICSTTKFEENANITTTYYIKVYQGYKIKITDNIRSGRFAFSTVVPARNVPTIDYQQVEQNDLPNTVFTAGQDGYFACSYSNDYPIPVFTILANDGLRNYVDNKFANQKSTYIDPLISDVDNLEKELSTDAFIRVVPDTLENNLPTQQSYAENNSYCTDYIFIKKNTHVKISGLEASCRCAFSTVIPARDVSVSWYEAMSKSSAEDYDFVFDMDGYLGISREKTASTILFDVQNKGIAVIVKELGPDEDAIIYLPKFIYSVFNTGDVYRNVIQNIRLEGLADKKVKGFKVNGGRELPIFSPLTQSDNKSKINRVIDVTSNGITLKSSIFKNVVTKNSVLVGKTIKHLGIGDSWAAANLDQLNGEHKGSWNYLSEAVNEFMRTEIDLEDDTAKYISMGRVGNPRRYGEYKGETYMIRASNEGRGGWAACSFLRFPFSIRTTNRGTMSEKLAWDALGLGRKELYGNAYDESAPYTPYVADTEHRVQYLTEVAMGYYHWDYSTELLRWAEGSGSQSVYVAGNTAQQQTIDAAMEAALNNPENPFYDWATAISSDGEYAFSLAKYLERYKTLADDGITRLVIGETAGTEITQPYQLADYDICKPSHVTIELGMNDYNGLTAQQKADDVIALANVIKAFDSNIKIGIMTVHYNGALYSGYFTDKIASNDLADTEINGCYTSVNGIRAMNTLLSEAYPSEDGTNNVYYIPSYFIQGCTRAGARIAVTPNGNEIINDGVDYIHPDIDVHKEMGQQLWAWLLYTL